MAKRPTIGDNPLDAMITSNRNGYNNALEEKQERNKKIPHQKQRITVQISLEVIERVKNAVYWTPGLTLAALAEDAFIAMVDQLESARKKPFPKRREELKTGRPIG